MNTKSIAPENQPRIVRNRISSVRCAALIAVVFTIGTSAFLKAGQIAEVEPNNTIATAQNVDGNFTTNSDSDIVDSTTMPHVTVLGTGDNSVDVYRFTVSAANATCVFDVDYGMPGFDSMLRVMNGSGTVLASNDDSPTTYGAGGSSHQYDAYVAVTIATPGTYYVEVSKYSGFSPIPNALAYRLQVSVPLPQAPAVTASAPTSITNTSAQLNGTVNPNGSSTSAAFQYGLTAALGSSAAVNLAPGNGSTVQNVLAVLTGLSPGTTYHYRLNAASAEGSNATAISTFTTVSLPPPSVTIGAVTGITTTSATLNGTVNPNGSLTSAAFQYDVTPALGSSAPVTLSPNNGSTVQNVSAVLTGLSPGTTYYYRLNAASAEGASPTALGNFTTIEPGRLSTATGWPVTYNDPSSGTDIGRSVAVDAAGNVAVVGQVAANSGDYYTAKYSPGGALLWQRTYNNATYSGQDSGYGVAFDAGGNVIVTGQSYRGSNTSGGTEIDFYTAKYAAADGAILWERHYNNAALNSDDRGYRLLVDGNGDVIVNGYSFTAGAIGNQDYYTAKYQGTDGALVWEARYNGPADKSDIPGAMALDTTGNVIVTGYSIGTSGNFDYFTIKYAGTNGAVQWERRYDGPGNGDDYANAVAVDAAGNAVVTGNSSNGSNDDIYTAKYAAANGALLWEKRYDGPATGADIGNSIAMDGAGNAIVTGESNGSGTGIDFYTVKYATADGTKLWDHRYNGPASGNDQAFSVAVNGAGNPVVFGRSSNGSNTDYFTCTYDGVTALMISSVRTNGPANQNDHPGGGKALALSPTGQPVVTGATETSAGGPLDIFTVIYGGQPLVLTQAATAITTSGATLNGTANPVGLSATAWFEYGATTSYGTSTTTQNVGSGTNSVPLTANLTGLVDGTLFHFRIVSQSVNGTSYGADMTFTTLIDPEIAVEEPVGTNLADGTASIGWGDVLFNGSVVKTFTIRNTGTTPLRNIAIIKDGTNAADFTVSAVTTPLAAGADTTFTVTFAPGALGARAAALHIASNDVDENPFDIALTGTGVTPEIAVEQPVGTDLTDGTASISYGALAIGTNGVKTFTIKNTGTAPLTGIAITHDGTNAGNYSVSTTGMGTAVATGGSATFTVTFAPTGTISSTRTAAIHLSSSDLDENPFDIALTGDAYSTTADVDADGLNDWAEHNYIPLGFNWQVGQPALVTNLFSNLGKAETNVNTAGYFSATQVQALNVGTPLIQRNTTTGIFTLTIGVEKSTTLQPASFTLFPMTAPQTIINGAGKLEFQFSVPDNATFFQLRAE